MDGSMTHTQHGDLHVLCLSSLEPRPAAGMIEVRTPLISGRHADAQHGDLLFRFHFSVDEEGNVDCVATNEQGSTGDGIVVDHETRYAQSVRLRSWA